MASLILDEYVLFMIIRGAMKYHGLFENLVGLVFLSCAHDTAMAKVQHEIPFLLQTKSARLSFYRCSPCKSNLTFQNLFQKLFQFKWSLVYTFELIFILSEIL